MLKNNHKNLSCGFSEQMVSYFYDEINQAEKAVFETHLTNCSHCTDELAGFELVSSTLVEWRDEEFFKLDAPVFEIPVIKTVSQSVESDSRSWFSNLWRIVSLNPMTATAVLAALIVCVGLVFIAINFTNNSEIAEVDNRNSERIVVSPTVAKIDEQPIETLTKRYSEESLPGKSPKSTGAKSKDSQPLPIREKRFAPNDSVDRVSDKTKDNFEKPETNRNLKETNRNNKKSTAVQKQPVPNLTTLDDDEDKSVRLADLFEEIGSK